MKKSLVVRLRLLSILIAFTLGADVASAQCPDPNAFAPVGVPWTTGSQYEVMGNCYVLVKYCWRDVPGTVQSRQYFITEITALSGCGQVDNATLIRNAKDKFFQDPLILSWIRDCAHGISIVDATCWKVVGVDDDPEWDPVLGPNKFVACDVTTYCVRDCQVCVGGTGYVYYGCTNTVVGETGCAALPPPNTSWQPGGCYKVFNCP